MFKQDKAIEHMDIKRNQQGKFNKQQKREKKININRKILQR
jgi:hypothetical protein